MRSYVTIITKKTFCNQVSKILEVKKLILVLAAPTSMISARKEALEYVSGIHYPVQFIKRITKALINSRSKVNAIHSTFAKQLGLSI